MLSAFLYILALVLVIAKLSGVLAISWFLALLPALIPLALVLVVLLLAAIGVGAAAAITMKKPTRFAVRR